jgi:hypothetical protein
MSEERRAGCLHGAPKFSGGYVVRDANGFAVAYVYGRSTEDEAITAKQRISRCHR